MRKPRRLDRSRRVERRRCVGSFAASVRRVRAAETRGPLLPVAATTTAATPSKAAPKSVTAACQIGEITVLFRVVA